MGDVTSLSFLSEFSMRLRETSNISFREKVEASLKFHFNQ